MSFNGLDTSADGHISCFLLAAMINRTEINIFEHEFLGKCMFSNKKGIKVGLMYKEYEHLNFYKCCQIFIPIYIFKN